MDEIKMGEHQSRDIEPLNSYKAGKPENYQCQICGGYFNSGHFCTGKNKNTPEPVDVDGLYKQIQQLQADKEELRDGLIKIAARLLIDVPLSNYQEDYSFKVPKHHLNKIEQQTNKLRLMAIEIRELSDSTQEG